MKTRNFILIGVLVIQGLTVSSQALQPEVLYEFQQGPRYPSSKPVQANDGSIWGATSGGGIGGSGTVFKVSTNGILTIMASLGGASGVYPSALVLGEDGNFYGPANDDGSGGWGTVFKVTPNGVLSTLVSFDGTNGASPRELISGKDGNLYGATSVGGSSDYATVFKVTTNGTLTTLHAFDRDESPASLLLDGEGNLYGTILKNYDSRSPYYGTVFKLTTNGTLTTLVTFNGTNGAHPTALVFGNDGNLYGMTYGQSEINDSHPATVFRATTDGVITTLASFDGDAMGFPDLALGRDGNFYGMTGRAWQSLNKEVVFKMTHDGNLTALSSLDVATIGFPYGLAFGNDGNLYATSLGSGNVGTVLKVTTNGELSTLIAFNDPGGIRPTGLTLGPDGKFYGATGKGGSDDAGTVFIVTTNGLVSTLASFVGNYWPDGYSEKTAAPSSLVSGSDGNFYGVTWSGGEGRGTVFRLTAHGELTTLVSTFHGTNGVNPNAALVLGRDGNLFGTTASGGTSYDSSFWLSGSGTVFKVTPTGELTSLASFSGTNRAGPNELVFGPDGDLYGTTWNGGSSDRGTVFKVTTEGALTTLISFSGTNGAAPTGPLVFGPNGELYGTTNDGGSNSVGTVFRVTTKGQLTTLVSFNGINGAYPYAGLMVGNDGNFYGTTSAGGSTYVEGSNYAFGSVFKMTPGGELTTLFSFNGANGGNPGAALVLGKDGNLYGTTPEGGRGGGGTIFRIVLPKLRTLVREPGGSFLLTGTGPANDSYRLWASIDLSLPFAAWTLLTSGSFDSTGHLSFTDATTNRSRFYLLSVP